MNTSQIAQKRDVIRVAFTAIAGLISLPVSCVRCCGIGEQPFIMLIRVEKTVL